MDQLTPNIIVGFLYPRSPVTAKFFGYDRFPPVVNGWGTMHLMLDMALPLQAKEEGPPIKKELISGATHISLYPTTLDMGGHDFPTWLPNSISFLNSGRARALMSYPVPRKREQSFHTCAQDVQITRIVTT
jgi:hypothetical protein